MPDHADHEQDPEMALARREQRLSLALGAADIVGIWDGDLKAGLVYGDANFARIYGVDPVMAAQGAPSGAYLPYIHPDDLPAVRDAMARMFAGSDAYFNEHRILRPDGTLCWVLTRGRLVRDADGTPLRFSGVSLDITERRRAEARQALLLELSDRLRALAEPRAIVATAVEALGRHLGASRAGYGEVQPDEATIAVETGYSDRLPPLSGRFPLDHWGEAVRQRSVAGQTIVHDGLLPAEDGRAATGARAFVSVPLLRDGRLRATLFVSHRDRHDWTAEDVRLVEEVASRIWDALERARAEEALRRLNASLEQQVAQRTRALDRTWRLAPVLMVIAEPDGTLIDVNPAWSRVLGWTAAETIGRNVMLFVAPEDEASSAAGMARLAQGEPVVEFHTVFLTTTGERRRIAWNTVPEGGRLYGFGRDVTDQMLAEERLRQAQKMEAVGQLTGGLAHDFNNLLTGIMGSLELLQTRLAQGRTMELARHAEAASGAARRAAALTQRLLAFSRRQTLDPHPTDINRLVDGMHELVLSTVGTSLEVVVQAEDGLWTTLVDPHQLENALLNLCINARDAMPHGGRLTIATANLVMDAAAAAAHELPAGDYLALSVTDTGHGMTPEVMRRAFDPFFTTKPLGMGTGLGLSMIYGFARQSGGHAAIRSAPGEGTTVSVILPRFAGTAPAPHDAPPHAAPARGSAGAAVLVVDDDATVRLLVCEVAEGIGCTATPVADGAAALAVLQSGAAVDLLITDVGLPGGVNGRQLADAGRLLRPALRVLLITGYAEAAVVGRTQLDPGMQLLTKPFELRTLAGAIDAMLTDAVPAA
jgi:PAS domain S-box-containing protein